MVKVKSIHHMTLNVGEGEKARDFYGRVLGLQEIKKPREDLPVIWFGAQRNELHLMIKPGSILSPTDLSLNGRERGREGRHVAFTMEGSLDDIAMLLEAENIPYRRGTAGLPQIFCEDPFGNFLELNTGWDQEPI